VAQLGAVLTQHLNTEAASYCLELSWGKPTSSSTTHILNTPTHSEQDNSQHIAIATPNIGNQERYYLQDDEPPPLSAQQVTATQ
jgi:hypothetical protein